MTSSWIATQVAAVLSTLLDMEEMRADGQTAEIAASQLYLALGMDYHKWEMVASALKKLGYCHVGIETIRLLPPGRVVAKRVNEAIAACEAKQQVENIDGKVKKIKK